MKALVLAGGLTLSMLPILGFASECDPSELVPDSPRRDASIRELAGFPTHYREIQDWVRGADSKKLRSFRDLLQSRFIFDLAWLSKFSFAAESVGAPDDFIQLIETARRQGFRRIMDTAQKEEALEEWAVEMSALLSLRTDADYVLKLTEFLIEEYKRRPPEFKRLLGPMIETCFAEFIFQKRQIKQFGRKLNFDRALKQIDKSEILLDVADRWLNESVQKLRESILSQKGTLSDELLDERTSFLILDAYIGQTQRWEPEGASGLSRLDEHEYFADNRIALQAALAVSGDLAARDTLMKKFRLWASLKLREQQLFADNENAPEFDRAFGFVNAIHISDASRRNRQPVRPLTAETFANEKDHFHRLFEVTQQMRRRNYSQAQSLIERADHPNQLKFDLRWMTISDPFYKGAQNLLSGAEDRNRQLAAAWQLVAFEFDLASGEAAENIFYRFDVSDQKKAIEHLRSKLPPEDFAVWVRANIVEGQIHQTLEFDAVDRLIKLLKNPPLDQAKGRSADLIQQQVLTQLISIARVISHSASEYTQMIQSILSIQLHDPISKFLRDEVLRSALQFSEVPHAVKRQILWEMESPDYLLEEVYRGSEGDLILPFADKRKHDRISKINSDIRKAKSTARLENLIVEVTRLMTIYQWQGAIRLIHLRESMDRLGRKRILNNEQSLKLGWALDKLDFHVRRTIDEEVNRYFKFDPHVIFDLSVRIRNALKSNFASSYVVERILAEARGVSDVDRRIKVLEWIGQLQSDLAKKIEKSDDVRESFLLMRSREKLKEGTDRLLMEWELDNLRVVLGSKVESYSQDEERQELELLTSQLNDSTVGLKLEKATRLVREILLPRFRTQFSDFSGVVTKAIQSSNPNQRDQALRYLHVYLGWMKFLAKHGHGIQAKAAQTILKNIDESF